MASMNPNSVSKQHPVHNTNYRREPQGVEYQAVQNNIYIYNTVDGQNAALSNIRNIP